MEPVPYASEPHESGNKTILVVEDDEGIGAFLVEALKTEVCSHTLLVTDAIKALETVKTLRPDLVILDLPGINGLELSETFQAIEQLREVPTLLMSANLPKKAQKQHQKMVFLEKPFGLDELLHTITQLLPTEGSHTRGRTRLVTLVRRFPFFSALTRRWAIPRRGCEPEHDWRQRDALRG